MLTGFSIVRDGVYVSARAGATTRVLRVSADGSQQHELPTPFNGTAAVAATYPRQGGAIVSLVGWIEPEQLIAASRWAMR